MTLVSKLNKLLKDLVWIWLDISTQHTLSAVCTVGYCWPPLWIVVFLFHNKALSSACRLATHCLTAPCQDQTKSRLNAYTHTCRTHAHKYSAVQSHANVKANQGRDKASQTLSLMRWITRHAPLGIANHKTVCLFSVHIYRLPRQQSDLRILTNINPAAIIWEPAGCASHAFHCSSQHATGTFVWTGLNLIGVLRHTTEAVKRWSHDTHIGLNVNSYFCTSLLDKWPNIWMKKQVNQNIPGHNCWVSDMTPIFVLYINYWKIHKKKCMS